MGNYFNKDRTDVVAKGLGIPASHHNNVAEYQLAGIPYVTSSQPGEVSATPIEVKFPRVSQWVMVTNLGYHHADLRVGFTEAGVQSHETANYFVISGTDSGAQNSTQKFDVRCNRIWLRRHGGISTSFSLIAGLTSVPEHHFFVLSASENFQGVG